MKAMFNHKVLSIIKNINYLRRENVDIHDTKYCINHGTRMIIEDVNIEASAYDYDNGKPYIRYCIYQLCRKCNYRSTNIKVLFLKEDFNKAEKK